MQVAIEVKSMQPVEFTGSALLCGSYMMSVFHQTMAAVSHDLRRRVKQK